MYTTLVSVEQLAAHLSDSDWRLLDCRFSLAAPLAGAGEYAAGHIPGAAYLNLDEDLSGPRTPHSGRHPLPDPKRFAARLGELGIDSSVQVVAYDDASGMFAARAWWLTRELGHRAVAVLDGGIGAWRSAGGTLSTRSAPPAPRVFSAGRTGFSGLSPAEVAEGLAAGRIRLLDVRAAERFEGRTEPLDRVAGHVPGARNLPYTLNLDRAGGFLEPAQLRELFTAQAAIGDPGAVVCMCGSGVTACHTLLALEVAGLPGARLYPGSWSEWCADPSRPVATGPA